jgi:hypothetical protein
MPNALENFLSRIFSPVVEKTVRETLSVAEDANSFLVGTRRYDETDRDRYEYDREDTLDQCLTAWRSNPLARRIVELTSQYVVGGGLDIKCDHESTRAFIGQFWNHRLNRMDSRIIELCDELTRTGNLFILISTDQAGMSYIRAIPASNIDKINHAPNDIEQPTSFQTKADPDSLKAVTYQAYDPLTDAPDSSGRFPPVMLHYAINRPAGAQWGESDLAPVLIWLSRYSAWLEDRVRLNRFRNAFLYIVSGQFTSEVARKARQTELAANPPTPGSILVTDETETWSVISPKLEALDANQDGMAIKKMVAASVGVPLHFLAEPESSTRTTAEAAGGPTFRRFEQRQEFFLWLLSDLLRVVISRRALFDGSVKGYSDLELTGADISARDNVAYSIAGTNVLNMLERLYDMGLIDERELLRVAYRFAGESVDLDEILARGSGVDQRSTKDPIKPTTADPDSVNPETGEAKKGVTNL